MITFKRPDGKLAEAYLAEPVNPENAPGVVVIQEWWGLDDEIQSVAAGVVVTIGADGKMEHYNLVGYGAAACGLLTFWLVGYIHTDKQAV